MDNQQLEDIFSRHKDAIVRHLTILTRNPTLSEDLAQDTFIKFANYDHTDSEIIPHLYRIASQLAIDWFRKNGRRKKVFSDIMVDFLENTDKPEQKKTTCPFEIIRDRHALQLLRRQTAQNDKKEELEEVELIMEKFLNEKERMALTLFADGWSCADIAKEAGAHENTVKSWMYSGRQKIKRALKAASK